MTLLIDGMKVAARKENDMKELKEASYWIRILTFSL